MYEEPEELVTLIPVESLRAWIEAHPQTDEFKPMAFYNREGDMIEVHFENEHGYCERMGNFTIERAQECGVGDVQNL